MKADRRLMSQEATVKEERALKGWLPPKKRWTMTWQPSGSTQFWTTALVQLLYDVRAEQPELAVWFAGALGVTVVALFVITRAAL
eukprot:7107697-Pyramimonas_sp.AAC.1